MAGKDIEALVREFASKLEGVVRAQVVQELDAAVEAALGGGRTLATRGSIRALESRSGKRSPQELAKTADRLLRHIKSNPGQRAEQIAEGVGTSTKALALPLRKLVAEKRLKTKGVARGTTYTVA
jgi:hypothetical protein